MPIEFLRREYLPATGAEEVRIKWSGIFLGAFVTMGLIYLFMALGGLIGLPSIAAFNPLVTATFNSPFFGDAPLGPTALNWIYTLITSVLSFFIGGYCTSRMTRIRNPRMAGLYGIAVWGTLVTFALTLISFLSTYTEELFAGAIPMSSAWLAFLTMALGVIACALGGILGRVRLASQYTFTEEGPSEMPEAKPAGEAASQIRSA